jgi:hypothetical protein
VCEWALGFLYLVLSAVQVMQLQELLSAARAEVQIRGANIQILEENLAARRRRDVALTIADDEGQTVRSCILPTT